MAKWYALFTPDRGLELVACILYFNALHSTKIGCLVTCKQRDEVTVGVNLVQYSAAAMAMAAAVTLCMTFCMCTRLQL